MQQDLVDGRGWIRKEDYMEGLALAQLAPGPLAAQLAIYLGYIRAGVLGRNRRGCRVHLPSFLMVLALSAAYVRFGGLPWMQGMFYGIGAAVIGIIARSAFKLTKLTLGKDKLLWGIFAALAISTAWTSHEIIWLFLLGGAVNLVARAFPTRLPARSTVSLFFAPGTLATLGIGGILLNIFIYFAKAGLFVFGSGLAVVPFLYGGVVQGHHWLTDQQFVDAVAVAMITPGPVVITVAFIGYLVAGVGGATAAALGIFLPVYLVVVLLAPSYKRWAKNPQLNAFVRGVTAAATGAIAGAVIVLARRSVYDVPTILICAFSLCCSVSLEGSRTRSHCLRGCCGLAIASCINLCAPTACDASNGGLIFSGGLLEKTVMAVATSLGLNHSIFDTHTFQHGGCRSFR